MKVKQEIVTIDNLVIKDICQRLTSNHSVRKKFSGQGEGEIYIDRKLPFIFIYRTVRNKSDPVTLRLIRGESSYIIIPYSQKDNKQLKYKLLIKKLVAILQRTFNAVLLFELWAGPDFSYKFASGEGVRPKFNIYTEINHRLISTCEVLESGLSKVVIKKQRAQVILNYNYNCFACLKNIQPLLSRKECASLNCYYLGLEVQPIYRNSTIKAEFPLIFRVLHKKMSAVLKKTVFEFVRSNTSYKVQNYYALGPKMVNKAIWEVDHKLTKVAASYDLLLLSSPININDSWQCFKKSKFSQNPIFYYKPLPVDPALLKRKLYSIDIDRISDPTLGFIFRKKRDEMDKELSMIADRGTSNFLFGSLQLYGVIEDPLLLQAKKLLHSLPDYHNDDFSRGNYTALDFIKKVKQELRLYKVYYPRLTSQAILSDEIPGLMCSEGNILVGKQIKISNSRVEALLQHEVGTHIITHLNGLAQPLHLLSIGLNGYHELQEGLAVFTEYLVGQLNVARLRLLAGRVIAAKCICKGENFIQTYSTLVEKYNFSLFTAFKIVTRIFRSGGTVKDAVYLRGLIRLLDYLVTDRDFNLLFTGKFAYEHIAAIKELYFRRVLIPPKILPTYLKNQHALNRLNAAFKGITPLELINHNH